MDKVFVIQKLSKSLEFINSRVVWIRSAIDGIKRAESDVKCYPDRRHANANIKDIVADINKVLAKAEIADDAFGTNAVRDLERYEKLCDRTRTKILRLQDGIRIHDAGVKNLTEYKAQLKKQYGIIVYMTGCASHVNSHVIEILNQFLTGEFSVYKNFAIANSPVKTVKAVTGQEYCTTFGPGECKWYCPIISFSACKKQFNIKIACITFTTSGKSLNMYIEMFKVGRDEEYIYDVDASVFKNPNRYESVLLTKINPFPGDRFIAREFTELGPLIDEDKRTVVTFKQQVRGFIIRTIDELIELEVPEFAK